MYNVQSPRTDDSAIEQEIQAKSRKVERAVECVEVRERESKSSNNGHQLH